MPWTSSGDGDGPVAGHGVELARRFFRHMWLADPTEQAPVVGALNELAASHDTASEIDVATGAALVYGTFLWNDAAVTLALAAVGADTAGIVVVGMDWTGGVTGTAQTGYIRAVQAAGGSTTFPTPTQSDLTNWEVEIARYIVDSSGNVWTSVAKSVAGPLDTREFAVPAPDGSTLERSGRVIRVKDLGIVTAKIANLAVTTGKLADLAVTSGKLAANAVIAGKIATGGVSATGQLADDIVDDTKAGNRVPQFYRRQGGSATDWDVSGTTTRTPTAVRMQAGAITGGAGSTVVVTFPVAFSAKPLVFATATQLGDGSAISAIANNPTTTQVTLGALDDAGAFVADIIFWLAIGAE
jgi:hypothetical protein